MALAITDKGYHDVKVGMFSVRFKDSEGNFYRGLTPFRAVTFIRDFDAGRNPGPFSETFQPVWVKDNEWDISPEPFMSGIIYKPMTGAHIGIAG